MEPGLVIGAAAGILGGLIGVLAALAGLGCFDYLGGKHPPGSAPVEKEELRRRLLALNDPARPYQIIPADDCDLRAEWKIADATWYGVFNKSGLKQAYTAFLRLDEARHSVRCFEQYQGLRWTKGAQGLMPHVSWQRSFFSGRLLFFKSRGVGYGFKRPSPASAGKVYEYHFDVDEVRGPIAATVVEAGWEWVPVTARRHVVDPAGTRRRTGSVD